jgi:hypothetical protein
MILCFYGILYSYTKITCCSLFIKNSAAGYFHLIGFFQANRNRRLFLSKQSSTA